jgi:DNA-binding transcriptional ArsR family regulator
MIDDAATPALFGSPTRTRILLAIALLKETYISQLVAVLDLSKSVIFRIVDDLERDAVIVSRYIGRTRTVSLNPRMYGAADLESFLLKYAKGTDVEKRVATVRKRPRRRNKEL